MSKHELNGKTVDELKGMIAELRKEQFRLNVQKRLDVELKGNQQFSEIRRDIARIKTKLHEQNKGQSQ